MFPVDSSSQFKLQFKKKKLQSGGECICIRKHTKEIKIIRVTKLSKIVRMNRFLGFEMNFF